MTVVRRFYANNWTEKVAFTRGGFAANYLRALIKKKKSFDKSRIFLGF